MDYADDYSGYGNSVLYNMCENKLLHDDIDVIKSKLWIIGRSYAASIERKAGSEFKIEDAAEILKSSEIDAKIAKLRKIGRPTKDNIIHLLSAHNYLVGLFKKATGLDKRSLASKYLHFHAPKSVFIYDSIVRNKLRKKFNGKRFPITKKFDDEYESHLLRCLYYRDNIYENHLGKLASPRKLDTHLYE
ncbi:hypothetical protein [Colwellia sp. Arc7-D]|uniref:hypothetical protein n=1 Tax=Colwellia sp. Arc7-D TaxID=2161872 RepID=UPI000D383DFE|nr:hypothetical protein [Colwellia sp. Arc7-D]AWB56226.1 hypothetical protein DBO93_00680 [Colwellia sp. Arc7-D]